MPIVLATLLSTMESFGLRVLVFGLFCVALLLVWLMVTLGRMIGHLLERRWAEAATRLLLLLMLWPMIGLGFRSGHYVHLAAMYPSYRADTMAARTACGEDIRFPWGDHAASPMDGIHFETLIYHCTGAALVDQVHPPGAGELLNSRNEHLLGPWYIEHATTD